MGPCRRPRPHRRGHAAPRAQLQLLFSSLVLFACFAAIAAPATARPPPPPPPSDDARAIEPLRDLVQRSGRAVIGWKQGTDPCGSSGGGDCAVQQPNPQKLPACPWSGVSCRAGRVVAIDLSCDASDPSQSSPVPGAPLCVYTPLSATPLDSRGLATVFPQLTELRALGLRGAGVQGGLPREWGAPGSFPKLQLLDLADNALAGPVPVEWWTNWGPDGESAQGGGNDNNNNNNRRIGAAAGGGVVFFYPLLPQPPPTTTPRERGLSSLRMLDLSGNCALCGDDPFPAGPALVNTRGTAIPLDCSRVSLPQGVGGVGAGLGSGCSPGSRGGGSGGGGGASYRVLMNILAAAGVIAVAIALGVCQQRLCPWLCCGSAGGGPGSAYVDARWLCCWRLQRLASLEWLRGERSGTAAGGAGARRPGQQQQQQQQPPVKFFEAVVELGAPLPHAAMSSSSGGGSGGGGSDGDKKGPAAAAEEEEAGPSGSGGGGPSSSGGSGSSVCLDAAGKEERTVEPAAAADDGDEQASAAPPPPAEQEASAPLPPPGWRARIPPWLRPGQAAAAPEAATPSPLLLRLRAPPRRRRSRRTPRRGNAGGALAAPPAVATAAAPREPPPPTVVVLPDHGIALMRRCDDDDDDVDDVEAGRRGA